MTDLLKEKNDLLEAIKGPERKRKQPSNTALWVALIFANVVFALLDVISAYTVYSITAMPLYGILTFLAGFAPLILHEFLWARAFASPKQKTLALAGAALSLFSIVGVGIMAGIVNVMGIAEIGAQVAEAATIIALVLFAFTHAILSIAYFYNDEGILATQYTEQAIARAVQQGRMIQAGDFILGLTSDSVNRRKEIESKYRNPEAMQAILSQMMRDDDQNGIPDVLEGKGQGQRPQRPQMQEFSPNGHEPVQAYNSDVPDFTNGAGK